MYVVDDDDDEMATHDRYKTAICWDIESQRSGCAEKGEASATTASAAPKEEDATTKKKDDDDDDDEKKKKAKASVVVDVDDEDDTLPTIKKSLTEDEVKHKQRRNYYSSLPPPTMGDGIVNNNINKKHKSKNNRHGFQEWMTFDPNEMVNLHALRSAIVYQTEVHELRKRHLVVRLADYPDISIGPRVNLSALLQSNDGMTIRLLVLF